MSKTASGTQTQLRVHTGMTTRTLVSCSLLSALSIIFARFVIPMPSETMRFSIEALPVTMAGLFFGPIAGLLVGFASDTIGCLFSPYGWNFVFTVPPMLYGLAGGLLRVLLKRKVNLFRILGVFAPPAVLGSVLWQSFWLSRLYGSKTFLAFIGVRSVQFAVTVAVNSLLLLLLFRSGAFQTLRLWPPKAFSAPSLWQKIKQRKK